MDGPLADVTTMACFYTFLAGPSFVLCFRRFLTSPRFVTTVSVLDWTQTTMYYYRLQLCTREQRLRKRGEPGHPPHLKPISSNEDTQKQIIPFVNHYNKNTFDFLMKIYIIEKISDQNHALLIQGPLTSAISKSA